MKEANGSGRPDTAAREAVQGRTSGGLHTNPEPPDQALAQIIRDVLALLDHSKTCEMSIYTNGIPCGDPWSGYFMEEPDCTCGYESVVERLKALSPDRLDAVLPHQERAWQPISTAPKDGTPVLLWWLSEIGSTAVAYWACGRWVVFLDGSSGWVGESFHASEDGYWTRLITERPTHWQPLPSPPSEPPR